MLKEFDELVLLGFALMKLIEAMALTNVGMGVGLSFDKYEWQIR